MNATIKPYPVPHSQNLRRISLRTTKRVIAPYMRARLKPTAPEVENKFFDSYLKKKPTILLSDTTKIIADGVDLISILNASSDILKTITDSATVTVYLVDDANDEIYQISGLPQLQSDEKHRISYKISRSGSTVASYVAYHKTFLKLDDLLHDSRFPDGLGTGEVTIKAVLCVPIVTSENECIAIIELYRNLSNMEPYEDSDLTAVITMCQWISFTIEQNHQRLTLQRKQELNDYLMELTKCYFADTMLLDKLITEVVNLAKITLNAEHGLFFVIKPKYGELFADFYEEGKPKKLVKIIIDDKETNIVNLVLQTGITVNIRNAMRDSRVTQDPEKGYITRSVLCMPIIHANEILGIIQLVNKKRGGCFTKSDEMLFETFTVYSAFVLSYARLNDRTSKTKNLNDIYLEMIAHHVKPCVHDFNVVYDNCTRIMFPRRFQQFDFYITEPFEQYMPQLLMHMFHDVVRNVYIEEKVITKFLLTIRNCYNNNPYHNFTHAFHVCHCIYNMLRRNMDMFTFSEVKALCIAGLCHDIDHSGVTNHFLRITNHDLMQLYGDSAMENYHFNTTMYIIKTSGLFLQLPKEEYSDMITDIREAILATDLAVYFPRRHALYKICTDNMFDWANNEHRTLLKSTMMTAADLSSFCKPFTTAKTLTDLLYEEYYNEGDKQKLNNLCPLSLMDRDKPNMIPADQVQFLNIVVLPCMLILTKLMPNCATLYKEAAKLRDTWKEVQEAEGQKLWSFVEHTK